MKYIIASVISLYIILLSGCILAIPASSEFHYNAPETNQPTCAIGSFVMFAKETINVELTARYLQTNSISHMNGKSVNADRFVGIWNNMFPTNPIKCIYDLRDLNAYTNDAVKWGKPCIWVGNWSGMHTCLIYFHSNSVTYKHFTYDPNTGTNYTVNATYNDFFERTILIYRMIDDK